MSKNTTKLQSVAEEYITKKDNQSYGNLYTSLRKSSLLSYINQITKDYEMAEDVFSTVVLKIPKVIHQYNPKWKFSTWIFNIAKNESLQIVSKRKRESGRLDSINSPFVEDIIEPDFLENTQVYCRISKNHNFTEIGDAYTYERHFNKSDYLSKYTKTILDSIRSKKRREIFQYKFLQNLPEHEILGRVNYENTDKSFSLEEFIEINKYVYGKIKVICKDNKSKTSILKAMEKLDNNDCFVSYWKENLKINPANLKILFSRCMDKFSLGMSYYYEYLPKVDNPISYKNFYEQVEKGESLIMHTHLKNRKIDKSIIMSDTLDRLKDSPDRYIQMYLNHCQKSMTIVNKRKIREDGKYQKDNNTKD